VTRLRATPPPARPAHVVSPSDTRTLSTLEREAAWTLEEAEERFSDVPLLHRARVLTVATTETGLLVRLDIEGRRLLGLDPNQSVSLDQDTNELFTRLAFRAFFWTWHIPPVRGANSRVGTLDRFGVIYDQGQAFRVMGRCTGGGFSTRWIADRYQLLRSSLLESNQKLLVIVPAGGKIKGMRDRNGMIDLVEYAPPLAPLPAIYRRSPGSV